MTLHVRTAPGTEAVTLEPVRDAVQSVDPRLPVLSLKTLTNHRDGTTSLWAVTLAAKLFVAFGLIAGVLATAGVYGLRAYLVTLRRREIGIRMALGGTRADILGQLLREGSWMAVTGLLVGTVLAVGLILVLRQSEMLYQVDTLDPLVFAVAPLLLASATAAASYIPARRAYAHGSDGRAAAGIDRETQRSLGVGARIRLGVVSWGSAIIARRRRSMLKFRTIPASLLSLVLLSMAVLSGSAQQDANRPANQDPQAQTPQGQAPQEQAPEGQAQPQGQTAQGQTPQGPTFRGSINFVRVDVIVDDKKGEPVSTLTQAEFELLEDGKPVPVEQFSLVKVDGNPRPGAPPPREIRNRNDEELIANREDVRVFVFFLDDYHVRRANSMTVREPLMRFVQNQLRPNDIVAIMYPLSPVSDLTFTRNHDVVMGAINNFAGRKFDYTPLNQLEANYMRYPTEQVEKIRNDVVMGALRGLSVRLGSLREGRKSVIFVSEGFTAHVASADAEGGRVGAGQPDSVGRSQRGLRTARSKSPPSGSARQTSTRACARSSIRRTGTTRRSMRSIPEAWRHSSTGFDDLPSGPPPSFATDARALRMTQDTLRSISDETDGKAIVNRNTLEQGLQAVIRDSSSYYLLGYTSQTPNDGKFHQITVRVKRRDVNVRARRGFWAVSPDDAIRAATPAPEVAKPVQTALASIATSVQAGKYVRTWLGTERGEGGNTRVTLVWEPLTFPPGDRREPAGRVSLLAATGAGNVVFRGRAPERPIVPSATTGSLGPSGTVNAAAPAAPQRLTFDAPPGKVELRITVEGASGGTLDQEIRDVEVPDFTTPQVSLGTPRLYRARTLPELRSITSDPNAVPAAGREFARTDRVLVRFSAYAPGTEMPGATAVLLNRAGAKMSDLPVTPSTIPGTTHEITLGLSTVPAGEYLVEITAKSAAGETKALIPLRVTS